MLRISATWPAHLLMLDLITRIIFGEKHISQSSSLCIFLHYSVPSSLLGPNIFSELWQTKFYTHKKKGEIYSSVYLRVYIFGKQTARQKFLNRRIDFGLPLTYSLMEFCFTSVLKHLTFLTFAKDLLPTFIQ
jgi:hypothetical protein